MSVAVLMRFPHGQYQATPWDAATNSQTSEWPPSPWRLVRALLSVWHTRHPEINGADVESVLFQLSGPPVYWMPPTGPGHTRHYLPKAEQRTGLNLTELTLAPFLSVDPHAELVIAWPSTELTERQRTTLEKLVGSLPYLGRAESVVDARVLDAVPEPPPTWENWLPNEMGTQRLMCPTLTATREELEISPTQMRKGRRLIPEGSRWVTYEAVLGARETPTHEAHGARTIRAMHWRLESKGPFREQYGILATERLRQAALSVLGHPNNSGRDSHNSLGEQARKHDRYLLSGHVEEKQPEQHQHAHWLWDSDNGIIHDLYLWIPDPGGLSERTALDILRSRTTQELVPPRSYKDERGQMTLRLGDWSPHGFVESQLFLVSYGGPEVLTNLRLFPQHPTKRWRSVTPHVLNRRGKRHQSIESLAREDVEAELRYRSGDEIPMLLSCTLRREPEGRRHPLFRTYRWHEDMGKQRRSVLLDLEFESPIQGPLLLGGLSHFGFGRYEPAE